jgi:hypothetical protein
MRAVFLKPAAMLSRRAAGFLLGVLGLMRSNIQRAENIKFPACWLFAIASVLAISIA